MIDGFPTHDMHVHSTFSDGTATLDQNVRRAESLGLTELTLVDHVRVDTEWLPGYVAAVAALRPTTTVTLYTGIEAKILRTDGALDVPADRTGVDVVYIADHQVPGLRGPEHPSAVRAAIADGTRAAADVIDAIVCGTVNAMRSHPGGVLAHLFSLLPKVGLDERDVTDEQLSLLARTAHETGTTVEISERWRCPGPRALHMFARQDVRIVVSTDSHAIETLGIYDWCRTTWSQVGAIHHRTPRAA